MCYSLVWNPDLQRLQVVQLLTQAFGSVGAVVAWYRTAKVIQAIMLQIFEIPVFCYLDDFFFVIPEAPHQDHDSAEFVIKVFKFVVTELLGWELDCQKEEIGSELLLLGINISMDDDVSRWRFNPVKAEVWVKDFQYSLDQNWLPPSLA